MLAPLLAAVLTLAAQDAPAASDAAALLAEFDALKAEYGKYGEEFWKSLTPDADGMQWRLGPAGAGDVQIATGRYQIQIDYDGAVQRTGEGLYRVEYQAQGARASMLATQLEPIEARRLFPSFDEPSFRATFDIATTIPAQ